MLKNIMQFLWSGFQRFAAKRMFSKWASLYEEEVMENAYAAADKVARAAIPALAASRLSNPLIADIGIGTGLLAQQIYDAMPCRIAGLDFSQDMMAACAGRGITEILVKCDVGRASWPLEKNAYDMVVAAGLFEYLTPPMRDHFLREAVKILRRNAELIFTYLLQKDGEKDMIIWPGHSGHYVVCSNRPETMEEKVKDAGFDILEHTPPFKGCVFTDGSSYEYRMIRARKI